MHGSGYSGGRGRGRGSTSSSGSGGRGQYSNPCLTMHQPWASLLVHGIKRIEGRSWPSPLTGRLWIHAAGKVPDAETIKAMENFYREIYLANGITDIKFPEHYPVSRLLGCVDVVGCLKCEELVCWENVPESVRLEGLTDFCWLCENPQKLIVPFEMRGFQGVYNLEKRIHDAAIRGLRPVQGLLPVKFPLPDPEDPFSLRPGSLTFNQTRSAVGKTASIDAAIASARAAATQFSKKDQNPMKFLPDRQDRLSSRSGSPMFDSTRSAVEKTACNNAALVDASVSATQFSKKNQNIACSAENESADQPGGSNRNEFLIYDRSGSQGSRNLEIRRSARLQSGASSLQKQTGASSR